VQEVSVRKAFISVFIFTAAFVIGVVMSSPASAQTDVVIEHRGMCHDAAWFDTQPYQFNVAFGNTAIFNGIWDASDPKARFHVGITNNSANDIEAYVKIAPDGVGGPTHTIGFTSDVLYPMGPTAGTLGGGAFTFTGNAVIANGETAYIDYAPSISNGPEDVIVVIVQDGVEYEQAPVSRSCYADIELRDVDFYVDGGELKMDMMVNAGKVIQWARYDTVHEDMSIIIPLLTIQDETGAYVRVDSANGGFNSSGQLYTGHENFPSLTRGFYSITLSDQNPSLLAENICSATESVNMQILWATEAPHSGDTFQRALVDLPSYLFTVDPADFQDDCEAEGFELIPDPCQYDANLFENDPACVPSTTFEQSYSFDCATGPQWVVTNTGDEARTVLLQYQIGELNGTPQYAMVSSTTVPAGEEVTLDFADAVPAEDTSVIFTINTFSANAAPDYITQEVAVDCEPPPTPTPGPDQDTDEDGVPDKEEEDPSCVETKDCDEDNLEDLPDGDDLDPDQDDDGIKDGDEIEGCVLDPDPECDIEVLAVTGISTNRLLLYAFALMGLASMFVYSGRVFQRES